MAYAAPFVVALLPAREAGPSPGATPTPANVSMVSSATTGTRATVPRLAKG